MNKGNILTNLGLLDESKTTFEKILTAAEAQMGPLDPFTLKTIHNLAFTTYKLQKYSEAESLCGLAIAGREKINGKNHIMTLGSVELLGVIYHRQNHLPKSRVCLQTALVGYKALSGKAATISVYRTLDYLVQVCASEQNFVEARGFYEEAVEGYRKYLGEKHEATLKIAEDFKRVCVA